MATLGILALWSILSCGPKQVPTAPAPKPIPIAYGVTYSIDDAQSYDPALLLAFKQGIQSSLAQQGWESVALSIDPYTDVYAIEHQGHPIEGSSILSIPDVQVHLYYSKITNQLLLSLEFLYQEWFTQTRVDIEPDASLDEIAKLAIAALLSHVAQAQLDQKIPTGVSVILSLRTTTSLTHHTAERYRFLNWQGLAERLWSTGLTPYDDKPYGNPNLSVLNAIEPEPLSVVASLQGVGFDCRIVGRSRTNHKLYCQIEATDSQCVERTVEWSLAARKATGDSVCVGDECLPIACDSQYCCVELNVDDDSSTSQLCQNGQTKRWFLGKDDCRESIF